MVLGQEFDVISDFFKIHFTENAGMAFGLKFGAETGKLILTFGRIIAVIFITGYLINIIKRPGHQILITSISLILAGAIGNILDSIFYGILFSDSTHQVAQFLSEEGGYFGLFHGRVVDMLYFPIVKGYLPSWFPFWSEEYFIFFRPVFNIADASITTGVLTIIIFQRRLFKTKKVKKQEVEEEVGVS